MSREPVGIAMSGGVDSTATALLLKEKFELRGFFMDLDQPDFPQQKDRVEYLAGTIGIPLEIFDLKKQFRQLVLDYFSDSYYRGKTPNPCIICNRKVKFGLFLDAILAAGMERMATGHYARIEKITDEYSLHTGMDKTKDQSYFLSRLTQKQLSQVLFPLGARSKADIYRFMEHNGYDDFRGRESQDICFLKNKKLTSFLEDLGKQPALPGPIISTAGVVLGEHRGLYRYTIGQRRGLGLPDLTPWYVVSMDYTNNSLVVGKDDELLSPALVACSAHWLSRTEPENNHTYTVRIRYSHPGTLARIRFISDDSFRLDFEEPQRAVAPGQYAVIYDGDRVLGSGEIVSGQ